VRAARGPLERQAHMATTVADIVRILEALASPSLAETWDNVGLQVGDPRRTVATVWTALDPAPRVIRAACDARVDLLVTHHPLIFRALKRIDGATAQGASILDAVTHGLAIYAMHTNFDAAAGGLNDVLAERIGLRRVEPLSAEAGSVGRVGRVAPGRSVRALAQLVKRKLRIDRVRVAGDPGMRIERVALVAGSGGSLVSLFLESQAELFITGDLRYHDAREIEAAGKAAIDIGHFHSEQMMAEDVAARLRRRLQQRRPPVHVEACTLESDPFLFL
jgi:dinuclear metal center YbgI/SA1388 family protein